MRLVTRGDLDGLTSVVIVTLKEPLDDTVLILSELQAKG